VFISIFSRNRQEAEPKLSHKEQAALERADRQARFEARVEELRGKTPAELREMAFVKFVEGDYQPDPMHHNHAMEQALVLSNLALLGAALHSEEE